MRNKSLVLVPVLGVLGAAVIVFGIVGAAHAATTTGSGSGSSSGYGNFMHRGPGMGGMMGQFPGVAGSVTGINGTTISVQSKRASSTTEYSVDASGATVVKNGASSTVSAIAVGDMIFARGTVNGTSVTATNIIDGNFGMGGRGFPGGFGRGGSYPSGTRPFANGMHPSGTRPFASGTAPFANPAVSGTVASVNSNSLTVTGTNGTTYTVDVTNATLVKQGSATSSVSAINVGDTVQIQGSVSGTSVTANVILDNVSQGNGSHSGFFGAIQNFFSRLIHLF